MKQKVEIFLNKTEDGNYCTYLSKEILSAFKKVLKLGIKEYGKTIGKNLESQILVEKNFTPKPPLELKQFITELHKYIGESHKHIPGVGTAVVETLPIQDLIVKYIGKEEYKKMCNNLFK